MNNHQTGKKSAKRLNFASGMTQGTDETLRETALSTHGEA